LQPGRLSKIAQLTWETRFAPPIGRVRETVSGLKAILGGLSLGRRIPFPRCRSILDKAKSVATAFAPTDGGRDDHFAFRYGARKRPSLTPTSCAMSSFSRPFIRRSVERFFSGSTARL
jgi:hypothetical protein